MALARDPATGLILRDAASGLITTNCNCCGDEPCTCDQPCRAVDHGDDAFTCRCTPCSLRVDLSAITPICVVGIRIVEDVPASFCMRAQLAGGYRFSDYGLGDVRTYDTAGTCTGPSHITSQGTIATLTLAPGGTSVATASLTVYVGGFQVFAGTLTHTRATFDWADFPLSFDDVGSPNISAGATAQVSIECCDDCAECPLNCATCCEHLTAMVTGGASPMFDTPVNLSRDNPEDPTVCGWAAFGDPAFRNMSVECFNGLWTAIIAPGGHTDHQITWTASADDSGCPTGLVWTLQSNTYDATSPSLTITCTTIPCATDCTACCTTIRFNFAGGDMGGEYEELFDDDPTACDWVDNDNTIGDVLAASLTCAGGVWTLNIQRVADGAGPHRTWTANADTDGCPPADPAAWDETSSYGVSITSIVCT